MNHMMVMKQKQLSEAAAHSSQPFSGHHGPDFQMSETRIYVGLNDAETREQKYETEEYLAALKDVCKKFHVAFSVDVEAGGYYHEDGEYTEENSLVLILIGTDQETVRKIAGELCTVFHQESVLVTENSVNGFFVK